MATSIDTNKIKASPIPYMPKQKKRKPYKPKLSGLDIRVEVGVAMWLIMGGVLFGFGLARYVFTMSH